VILPASWCAVREPARVGLEIQIEQISQCAKRLDLEIKSNLVYRPAEALQALGERMSGACSIQRERDEMNL
jgi:hypothetical protein